MPIKCNKCNQMFLKYQYDAYCPLCGEYQFDNWKKKVFIQWLVLIMTVSLLTIGGYYMYNTYDNLPKFKIDASQKK